MPYRLRITGPDGKAKRLPLAKLPATVGRGEECECVIGDPQSSRKHARFETEPGTGNLRVVDMGSSNGTFHNGRKVERAVVNVGDRIRVGGTILEIESDVDVAFTDESGKKLDILKSLSLDKKQEKENTKSSLFARIGTTSKENSGGNQSEAQVRYAIMTDLLTAMTEFVGEEALFRGFVLTGLRRAPKGQVEIEVTFSINAASWRASSLVNPPKSSSSISWRMRLPCS